MSDNTLHLRSAFLLEQITIDRPKFLVKSGDYNWKIHRHLLYFHKQEQRLTRDVSDLRFSCRNGVTTAKSGPAKYE